MTPTEQQNAALAAFVSCVVEGLNPSLNAHGRDNDGVAYEVIIGGRDRLQGVVQEDMEKVIAIAKSHGGRAFIDCAGRGEPADHPLCIVWPLRRPDGPDPEGEHDAQAAQGRRKPRAGVAL